MTDIDIELTFENSSVPGGYVERLNEKRFKIVMNEEFIESLGALIASLVVMTDDLSPEVSDLTFNPRTSLEEIRGLVRKYLGSRGIKAYWQGSLAESAETINDSILQVMSRASMLRVQIAKHALLAACAFLTLHEACHAFGGHLAYRRKVISSLEPLGDAAAFASLREDQCALEMVCDISAHPQLFAMLASHDVAFEGATKLKRISGPDAYSSLYCCGFSVGFGIAVLFLLTDALSLSSPEEVPSGMRLEFVARSPVALGYRFRRPGQLADR